MSSDDMPTIKILIIGPSDAGKSALLGRYCDDHFDSDSSTATIGVDFKIKALSIHGKRYKLNLLDTAGQERFRTFSNSYYRGAHAAMLVYDISNRDSFKSMERWSTEATENMIEGAILYLVGSKLDRASFRQVQVDEGQALAISLGCSFCEVSSKTRENIKKPFQEVALRIVDKPELLKHSRTKSGLPITNVTKGDGACC